MSDDIDRQLTAWFAQAAEPLPGEHFMAALSTRLERQERRNRAAFYSLITLGVVLSAVATPFLIRASGALVRVTEAGTGHLSDWLRSPEGFAVSLVFGAWVVLRQRRRARA